MTVLKAILSLSVFFSFALSLTSQAHEEPAAVNLGFNLQEGNLTDPSQGAIDQAHGFYSKGSLKNADAIGWEGPGFVKIFRPRERRYATHDMVYILNYTANKMRQLFNSSDRLMIGDMSHENGGVAYGHNSHQNGLDVDIAFIRKNKTEQDPDSITGFEEKFVSGGKITSNFDLARNWALAKVIVSTNRVDRIFANPVIKKALCKYAKSIGEYDSYANVLHKIDSYSNHMDHYHVRLGCPLKSPKCESQQPLPPGTGC